MALPRPFARLFGPRMIKRWLPTSLFGRSLLIIILPIAIMQLAVTWVFFAKHEDNVTGKLSDGLARDIASLTREYREHPADLPTLKDHAANFELSVEFKPEDLPKSERRNPFRSIDRSLRTALNDHVTSPTWFDSTRYPASIPIWVKVDGGSLAFIAPLDRAVAVQGNLFILYLAGATLILTAVAILFIRNQVRAIERLANAAEAFGRGGEVVAFKPHGAREVRQAAEAFLAMRGNIQRFMEQRTALLASVSHDLRTPLTRLKLELALQTPSARTEEMKRDLAEMEHMIDEYLDFARGEGGEPVQPVRLMEIIAAVVEGARRAGANVTATGDVDLVVPVRRNAVSRALANLTDNAAAHGDKVEISLSRNDEQVLITVDDDGPGIDPDRYEEAFKPFSRLDAARKNAKGVGLGLAIARDVARSHGGEVTLEKSALGGLRAVLCLPV